MIDFKETKKVGFHFDMRTALEETRLKCKCIFLYEYICSYKMCDQTEHLAHT